jgi:hypothetical protein
MHAHVLTIPFDPDRGLFDDEDLTRFLLDKRVTTLEPAFFSEDDLDPRRQLLLQRLREWRKERAGRDGVPSYIIATNHQGPPAHAGRHQPAAGPGGAQGQGPAPAAPGARHRPPRRRAGPWPAHRQPDQPAPGQRLSGRPGPPRQGDPAGARLPALHGRLRPVRRRAARPTGPAPWCRGSASAPGREGAMHAVRASMRRDTLRYPAGASGTPRGDGPVSGRPRIPGRGFRHPAAACPRP